MSIRLGNNDIQGTLQKIIKNPSQDIDELTNQVQVLAACLLDVVESIENHDFINKITEEAARRQRRA